MSETPNFPQADALGGLQGATSAQNGAAATAVPPPAQPGDHELIAELGVARRRIQGEIAKRVVGQGPVIEQLLIALFSRGHCLFVGVPGLAKTLLISTLAEALSLSFNRIQFTPDLMPADITGTDIIQESGVGGRREFQFIKGPVFANIVLADEINRAPAKTQSAMLEAMQENKVTVLGNTYTLQPPFFVLATQNPIEQEGTYPLPEAQLDRFMFLIEVGYPSSSEEKEIARATTGSARQVLNHLLDGEKVIAFQQLVRRVPVPEHLYDYAVKIVRKTRPGETESPQWIKDTVGWGAGPRASQYLILGAKARAAMDGRAMPDLEDVDAMAQPVLTHRVVLNFQAEAEGVSAESVIAGLAR